MGLTGLHRGAAAVPVVLALVGVLTACQGRSTPSAAGAAPARPSTASSVAPSSSAARSTSVPTAVPSQDPRLLPPQPITGVDPTTSAAATVGVPTRVRIPSIGVDAPVARLGLEPDGAMQAPPDWDVPGWYAGGPRPGQVGPAVIAGHIDSLSGPAVFFQLARLETGDEVLVMTDAGRVLRFVVDGRQTFTKARFPTHLVYGPQPVPVLRLITCTGEFDAATGSYLSNLVVSAHLA